MAKNQNTATAEAPDTAPKEKKPETLVAKTKRLVLQLAAEIKDSGALYADTVEFLNEIADELASKHTRGVPATTQLAQAQDKRNAIYARMIVTDGKAAFASPEDEAMVETLTTKIANLKRSIAKAKKAETEMEAETESGPENNE